MERAYCISSCVNILWIAVIGSHALLQQQDLDMIAQSIAIRARVVDNLKYNTNKHIVEISLTNIGSRVVAEVGWKLYFHSFFLVEPDHFPGNYSKTILLHDQRIRVYMLQGDFFAIEPQQGFGELQPNSTKTISIFVAVWSIARTDFMPKWIIASDGLEARVINSTDDQSLKFVDAFVKPRQWKRYNFDRFNPYTCQERARKFNVTDRGKTGRLILPSPREITIDESKMMKFNVQSLKIQYSDDLESEAEYLSNKTGVQVATGTEQQSNNVIQLQVRKDLNSNPEDYTLSIITSSNYTQITGQSPTGVFYGIQSLLSIIASFPDMRIPDMRVVDGPRYSYRGMHLDVARNFHDVEDVKRLIRAMAMYKLNKLHLHLTDDEGWRLEIPGLPELTEVGGRRCFDLNETLCILPQYGSGPTNETSGSGFFSVGDYRTILSYAKTHHIEIIPEIDTPGHAHSAIRSMEQRYLKHAENVTAANYFRLFDANDTSQYLSIQMYTDNAINPCIESTYIFMEHVMTEVYKMHQDIQPLKIFHFGGDEVANGAWVNSTACKYFLTQNPKYSVPKGLKKYFVERVTRIAQKLNLTIFGWEDGYIGDQNQPFPVEDLGNHNFIANAWDNVWEWGAAMRAYRFANKGYKVVLSFATHLYFDHPYEPDPEERGLYWAPRFTDTKKTFGFIPDRIYDNIDMERSGKPLTKADVCGEQMEKCDPLDHPENILGIQGQMWSETIRYPEHMDYMIFPRLLALAERAWHKASWETITDVEVRNMQRDSDWESFANALGYKELKRLDDENIKYRVPPPGGSVDNSKIIVTSTFPGLKVQYSNDGGTTWTDVPSDLPWNRNRTCHLRTVSASGTRYSRAVQLFEVEPVPSADQIIVDDIANDAIIKYDIIDNINKVDGMYTASLTLTNAGQIKLPLATWKIYFYILTKIGNETSPVADDLVLKECGLSIHFVEGTLYYLAPVNGIFKGLKPGESIRCIIRAKDWNVARTDVMPNWYVTDEDMVPKVINSTADEELGFVGKYDTLQKWRRYKNDRYDPYTLKVRYALNADIRDIGKEGSLVIPTPYSIKQSDTEGYISFKSSDWKIYSDSAFENEANYLADQLRFRVANAPWESKMILIKNGNQTSAYLTEELNKESYSIRMNKTNEIIQIWATTSAGAFYGAQTLLSLSQPERTRVPVVQIDDHPRFRYRGIMLDVARNFQPKEEVMKLLDVMAMYKLNTLQLHLADDEGWRIQIPKLPELTQMGAKRCHDLNENECLHPAFGSGPDNKTSGSGYYTSKDYREIVTHAKSRHIKIIPDIGMPGHSRAAIIAMERRYLKYQGDDFRLSESNQTWKYDYFGTTVYRDSVVNVCMNSTFNFIDTILAELASLHNDIQPIKIVLFGGDRVPSGIWLASKACQKLMEDNNMINNEDDIKLYFLRNIASIAKKFSISISSFGNGFMDSGSRPFSNTSLPAGDLYVYPTDNIWEQGKSNISYRYANSGYKVILSLATHLFFDICYEPDPEERGFYWSTRYIDTRKVFGFVPDNIYANADVKVSGEELKKEEICNGAECLKLTRPENIIGVQGFLWTDIIRSKSILEHMAFPRMIALAERAWHKAPWEDIENAESRRSAMKSDLEYFLNTLGYKELKRLDEMNINYRIPPPGAIIDNGLLKVNSPIPGLKIEITPKGKSSWKEFTWTNPVKVGNVNEFQLRTRSADSRRYSRILEGKVQSTNVVSKAVPLCTFAWALNSWLWIIVYVIQKGIAQK
ncbi:hypothetical protein CHS0354_011761 [Potamilus streckersoni]|uniref:beta-N-acetylhexosaminidase n=1 Tax=Potamilus streckersoni TaxID=2493646 RepID=A0AAE0WCS8_9BIVA|nr:hypothetical protein CHS0354_011761 [Potamilus streckersoni]